MMLMMIMMMMMLMMHNDVTDVLLDLASLDEFVQTDQHDGPDQCDGPCHCRHVIRPVSNGTSAVCGGHCCGEADQLQHQSTLHTTHRQSCANQLTFGAPETCQISSQVLI